MIMCLPEKFGVICPDCALEYTTAILQQKYGCPLQQVLLMELRREEDPGSGVVPCVCSLMVEEIEFAGREVLSHSYLDSLSNVSF